MKRILFLSTIILNFFTLFAQTELPSKQVIFNNLQAEEFITSPAISFDGNYLIFSVKNDTGYKFYECKKNGTSWSEPQELTDITTFFGESIYKNSPVYNYDASKIYFEASNGNNNDIYESSRTSTGWTEPTPLPQSINTSANEGEPSISADDNSLYFVRFLDDKNPTCGTIFYSRKNTNFQWDIAMAVISPINTGCERTPRILSDNKTLIFASKRNKGKNFKLFYAKNLYNDIWILPVQIATFSKDDDMFPTTDYKGNTLYFTSSNKDKKSQIFSADLPSNYRPEKVTILTGKITDSLNNPIKGTITLLNPISMKSKGLYVNQKTGYYQIFIPQKSNLLLDFSGIGCSHEFIPYQNGNKKRDTINTELFENIRILLKVFDKDIYEPLEVDINITDANGNNINFDKQSPEKGRYILTLPIGKLYNIKLTSALTEPYTLPLDLSGVIIFSEFEKNIEIVSQKTEYTFNVTDKDENSAIQCQIVLTDLNTNQKITTTTTTDQNGNAKIFVRKGSYYDVTINPQGYAFFNTQFEVADNVSKTINVKLQPLKQDVKIELNNITFETNSADLNVNSYAELDKVTDLMMNNPSIKVEISAHTDDVGSDNYNLVLSERRAKSVVDYLVLHDVPVNRLIYKGYGESQPLFPNDTDEHRAQNRRVELKIVDVTN